VLTRLQAPVSWEPVDVTPIMKDGRQTIPSETIESIQRNKVALKGPLAVSARPCNSSPVPAGIGTRTPNLTDEPNARPPLARVTSRST
jgi:isocitrate dehydrogenase